MTSKHILSACSLALGLMVQPLSAATFGSFVYEDGATITITGYTQDTIGPVAIPAIIKGKPVGKIGMNAFKDSGLSDVTIPEGVTDIDSYAFFQCTNLKRVTLPSTISRLGLGAFQNCRGLKIAMFTGTAPDLEASVFAKTAGGFKVNFIKGSSGFTTPTWEGYPALAISPNPEITIQQPAGTGLVDATSKRTFGTAKLGKSGKTRIFTIKNLGAKPLTDLAIRKDGPHATDFIVSGPTSTYLPTGSSTTFKVTFKPTAKGTRDAAIHIKNNDSNENPFDIKLSGMGVKK